jgi:hypothetical protein
MLQDIDDVEKEWGPLRCPLLNLLKYDNVPDRRSDSSENVGGRQGRQERYVYVSDSIDIKI